MARAMPGAQSIFCSPPCLPASCSPFALWRGAPTSTSCRSTEIVLKPRLVLTKGADPDRANRVLEKGKTACLVTASLSVPVRLEAEILAAV